MIGKIYQHNNGILYTVIAIANELDTKAYPKTVVYMGPNGKLWTREYSDWERSFTLQNDAGKETN